MPADELRVHKTLAFLLRYRPDVGRLHLDDEGWCELDPLCTAVSRLLRVQVSPQELIRIAREDPLSSFETDDRRVRARTTGREPRRGVRPPDILYLPTSVAFRRHAEQVGMIRLDGRGRIRLFPKEHQAWLFAHRRRDWEPEVLYVDTLRAMNDGVVFHRLDGGAFGVEEIPLRHVLNCQRGFGFQVSAGGFLIRKTPTGDYEIALIRVRRRSGVTWEVAKGKLELGESPMDTACREVQEEMGIEQELSVLTDLGVSHYGFSTPAGETRLKVLHLFVLEATGAVGDFLPRRSEGIEDVAFFPLEEAMRAVTHGSLREPMRRLRRWLLARREFETITPDPGQALASPTLLSGE